MDILVVDDDLTTRKMLRFVLEQQGGHRVVEAANGLEALRTIERGPSVIELVISDMVMPVMGGAELYKHLSEADSGLARRVIFITGDTVAPETRRFLERVDNAVLAKPFRLRDVRESVRTALSR